MHRHRVVSCLVIVLVTVVGCGGAPPESTPEPSPQPEKQQAIEVRVDNVGFATPESVLYDSAADVYLVGNINGSPSDEDDNGFISRLAPDGTLVELLWIDGQDEGVSLDAPKGMAIIGDTLYVADISRVRSFDRMTGEPLGEIEIPGGTFVNDLAAGRDGWLLVSDSGVRFTAEGVEDTGSAAVYVISPEGDLHTVAAGEELERPNGVVDSMAHDGLVVVSFGGNMVYELDEDGARTDLAELPAGGLDGVVETPDGRLLVSSWGGGAIYAVNLDGSFEAVASDLPAPADIGYDSDRGVILVPLFNDDTVVILPDPLAR